jgi:hypothetical protein
MNEDHQKIKKRKKEDSRSLTRSLRLTAEEARLIDQKCRTANLSFSDLIRFAILDARPPEISQHRPLPSDTIKLIDEMSRTQRRLTTIRNSLSKRRVTCEVWTDELAEICHQYTSCMYSINRTFERLERYL